MDFGIKPFEPLKLHVPAEYYEKILKEYDYSPESIWPRLRGELRIDGGYRFTKFGLTEGMVTGIEICEIKKGDTFCGISLRQRPKKFQKLLAEAGFESRLENDGIDLRDHSIGFFIESGWNASICWE